MKLLILFIVFSGILCSRILKEMGLKKNRLNFEEEENSYGDGYIYYYDMPADDDSICQIENVNWNRPFLNLFIRDDTGQAYDQIVLEDLGTKTLFDLYEINKIKQSEEIKKKLQQNKSLRRPSLEASELQPVEKSVVDQVTEAQNNQVNNNERIRQEFLNIPFWKINKFRQVSADKRIKGVCMNYPQFMQDLAHMDPEVDSKTVNPVEFSLKNCIILDHEIRTGRTLLCHSRSDKMVADILQFLNDEILSITDNCEFLARHIRIQREKFPNRVRELEGALAGRKN